MNDKSLQKQNEPTDPLLEINSNKDQGAYAHLFYYLQLKKSDADFYNKWIYDNQKKLILKKVLDNKPNFISDIGCGDGYWHSYFIFNLL